MRELEMSDLRGGNSRRNRQQRRQQSERWGSRQPGALANGRGVPSSETDRKPTKFFLRLYKQKSSRPREQSLT